MPKPAGKTYSLHPCGLCAARLTQRIIFTDQQPECTSRVSLLYPAVRIFRAAFLIPRACKVPMGFENTPSPKKSPCLQRLLPDGAQQAVTKEPHMPKTVTRPDRDGTHRLAFERNKKKIYATQTVCGICGKPVDFSCKFPHPLSPCIDHIIPVAKGGHPSDLANLQLAHFWCNRQKSDKLFSPVEKQAEADADAPLALPLSTDWTAYRGH